MEDTDVLDRILRADNPFEALGLPVARADASTVTKAYRAAARHAHPDKSVDARAEQAFKELTLVRATPWCFCCSWPSCAFSAQLTRRVPQAYEFALDPARQQQALAAAAAAPDADYEQFEQDLGSCSSDEGEDLHELTAEEYLEAAVVEPLIDSVYATLEAASPPVEELVDAMAAALESADVTQLEEWTGEAGGEQGGQRRELLLAEAAAPGDASEPPADGASAAAYLRQVEAALVEAVRVLLQERPFLDEVPHFLANQLRATAAAIPLPQPVVEPQPEAELEPQPEPELEPQPEPELQTQPEPR